MSRFFWISGLPGADLQDGRIIIDQLSDEVEGKAKVGKVNVDEQTELASAFRVSNIPTLAVVKDGKVTAIEIGARSKSMKNMLGL